MGTYEWLMRTMAVRTGRYYCSDALSCQRRPQAMVLGLTIAPVNDFFGTGQGQPFTSYVCKC
jgi:hypothetical protein